MIIECIHVVIMIIECIISMIIAGVAGACNIPQDNSVVILNEA